MDRCPACSAALTPGVAWCGQCYAALPQSALAPAGSSRFAPGPSTSTVVTAPGWRPLGGETTPVAAPRTTRWGKTHTTFGPVGRVVSTLFLVGMFVFLLVCAAIGDIFALGAAGAWAVLIMPLGLRDVWKAGMITDRRIG